MSFMKIEAENHYLYLERVMGGFLEEVGVRADWADGLIAAHGDKAYSHEQVWSAAGIPFAHGVAMYLLTHVAPFSAEVRNTPSGWVAPEEWVVRNKSRFESRLRPVQAKE